MTDDLKSLIEDMATLKDRINSICVDLRAIQKDNAYMKDDIKHFRNYLSHRSKISQEISESLSKKISEIIY
jgi:predicted  nucleic acid-binding Zn-ribbon protein